MKKHYLFIDESGGKGYADNRERFPGELGVIAGYLIPDVYIKIYRDEIEGCLSNIESSGKIHIAEMEDKREIRGKVFETFGRLAIPWMYEAIFVEGFYQSEFCEGRGGCRSHTELLHAKIFIGLMLKVFASLHKFKELGVELVVVSDNLDKGVIKKLFKELEDHLALLKEGELKRQFKVYDKATGELLHCTSRATMDNVPHYPGLDISITCENSSMTFVSDVLANSVNYYLMEKFKVDPQLLPNSRQAIADHPMVRSLLWAYDANEQEISNLSDILYRREQKHLSLSNADLLPSNNPSTLIGFQN